MEKVEEVNSKETDSVSEVNASSENKHRLKWGKFVLILLVGVLAITFSALAIYNSQVEVKAPVEVVTVRGVTYETNLEVSEFSGITYANILINTPNEELVFKTDDTKSDEIIEEFLSSVDTLIPGEYVIATPQEEIRFIVDGIAE